MKQEKRSTVRTICVLTGIGLLIAATVLLILWQRGLAAWEQQAEAYVRTIRTLIPEPQGAALEEQQDNTMAVLTLDGADFVGILEMPFFDSALPVCADWGRPFKYPCCFNGSIYDGSIKIGATTQKGQYDFYREISVGDRVYFTDLTGNRYGYAVTDLRYEKHADQAALERNVASLTLFIKNMYAFEYLLVYCEALE